MQKFSLIVHDLTADTLPEILARLNGDFEDHGTSDNSPIDADGIQWDARIHATTKTKTAKGVWKRLKGVDDALFDAVKAELKASAPAPQMPVMGAPSVAPVAPQAPTAPAVTVAPQQMSDPAMAAKLDRVEAAMKAPTAAPVAPQAPTAPTMPPAIDPNDRSFNAFTQKMARLFSGNHVAPDYANDLVSQINTAWQAHGKQIATITDIANDQQLLEYTWQLVESHGFKAI